MRERYTVGARGDRGLIVSIPGDWAKKVGLKKGDEINWTECGGCLCLGRYESPAKCPPVKVSEAAK